MLEAADEFELGVEPPAEAPLPPAEVVVPGCGADAPAPPSAAAPELSAGGLATVVESPPPAGGGVPTLNNWIVPDSRFRGASAGAGSAGVAGGASAVVAGGAG